MKDKVKGILKYLVLFLFFFAVIQFLCPEFQGDTLYNYSFSYAVYRGEIPYLDFNMIVPPVGAFFYAVFFLLFGSSYLAFHIIQAFLLCILFYYLFQLYEKKAYLFLILICGIYPIPFITSLFPGYNFLLFLEFVLLFYGEKREINDYGIGVLLGLSFLTKQTVGFCFLLVSLYYIRKNRGKVLHRVVGFCIPCLCFFLYLVITKSLSSFCNLCFLGMFDFTSNNGRVLDIYFWLFLVSFLILIIHIVKDKNNISSYYVLAFAAIVFPLFDYYHVILFLLSIFLLVLDDISIPYRKEELFVSSVLFSLVMICTFGFLNHNFPFSKKLSSFPSFKGMVISQSQEKKVTEVQAFIKEHSKENLIILGSKASFFKIMNHMNITQYDLLNYGNHGYHGTDRVIQSIQKEKDPIFLFHLGEYEETSLRQQLNKEVMKYVTEHYTEVGKVGDYLILKGESSMDSV